MKFPFYFGKRGKNILFIFLIFFALLLSFFLGKIFELKKCERVIFEEREKAKFEEREKIYQAMQKKYNLAKDPKIIQTIEGVLKGKELEEKSIIVKITFPYDPLNYLFPHDYFKFFLKKETEIYVIFLEESGKAKREKLSLEDFFQEKESYLKRRVKIEAKEDIKGKVKGEAKRVEIFGISKEK